MLSRATSLTSMCQQLSQSVGVGTGAMLLYLLLAMHAREARRRRRFLVRAAAVGGISLLSVPLFLRMSPDAGDEVSGRALLALVTSGRRRDRARRRLEHPPGRRHAPRAIAEALARHDADILVLSEYRGGNSAARLADALAGSAIVL